MIEIGMNGIVKNFGFENVLNGASFEIMTGERTALVGRNGTGKSTILKIIAGEEKPEKGSCSIRRGASIGYLEQIPRQAQSETTTRQVLMRAFAPALQTAQQLQELEMQMERETNPLILQERMDNYAAAQSRFTALDGYAMEENFCKVASGFGLTGLLERPFHVLSGGQKTIVQLACTILKRPDILLLDEPTNHLDVRTLEWFEEFLAKYQGTVVLVSHDRYFLDRVANRTIVLEAGVCTAFHGNYTFSLNEQERLMLLEFEQYKNQQKKIDAMKAAIKRFREWGANGDNPKFFRKANELEKRLEKLALIDRPQLEKQKIPLSFCGESTGHDVLTLTNFSLTLGKLPLFSQVDFAVFAKERVCLMGDNATGKTALLKCILGENTGFTGQIAMAPSAKVGYIPQEIRFFEERETVLEAFRREHVCSQGQARSLLARFFICGDNVFKRVSSLSGGEKVLLKLSILAESQVNFLVLDEPTNHIDIDTREILEQALLCFEGTILLVSHDRYFINKIANRICEIKHKALGSFYGSYDDYRQCV